MLKSLTSAALSVAVFLSVMGTAPAQARTIELAFLPPALEPQDICRTPRDATEDDLTTEGGDEELTDRLRIQYLGRDIRRHQADDADRWFDWIDTLITRMAVVDENFVGSEELLARVALHIDAGRLDELRDAKLVDQLRQMSDQLTNNQRLIVAQYFMTGIGTARDEDFARELILAAAFGGNANALLQLAKLELEGKPVDGWDAPLDLTVTMAFGGLLGQLTPTVCGRAERIARQYEQGDVVSQNGQIAYAWYKFAADMGSATGAWRVVEYHLAADAIEKDNAVMLQYLRLAAQRGIAISEGQVDSLKSSGAIDEAELQRILGYNYSEDTGRHRPAVSPYFNLAVNIDGIEADPDDSLYMKYLRELIALPGTPGFVYTNLAKDILVRRGRWAGEAEAISHLETAVSLRDGEGTQILGKMLVRYRDDPARLNRAIDLLTEAVTRHGLSEAMDDLDALYRCQAPDAPRLREANTWARNYRAALHQTVGVSATDLIALDPFKEPLRIAQIQTQALQGRVQSLANYLERVQVDPFARDGAHRLWADRLDNSDQALEAFAELEFELATNPFERTLAVELFRRIYLNNGVTTALDLAIALTEDNAKDPAIAKEILDLLVRAGNRGEGAAIRLRARHLAPAISHRAVYEEYAQIIEDRGDFLALMFALPFVAPEKSADYFDRAVSLMNCGTKDVAELGDAHALRNAPDMAYHWQQVSLNIDGGHVLSKLRLSDLQMEVFDEGAAPSEMQVYQRALDEGDQTAHRRLYRLTGDPDLRTYNPGKAADHLAALAGSSVPGDQAWVLANYRKAVDEVRDFASGRFDINQLYQQVAREGDTDAKVEFAMLLRDTARTPGDLASSARLLEEAAEAGNGMAMLEFGYALGYGIGIPRNLDQALGWLERADQLGQARAASVAALLRLSGQQ
ncbi:tetratricopeptide repeat protein [Oceaniglobus ichthyenteri]|uniref:tetratricopeptide repeat protein n=1 Tax=Oceaniglobus ichthyenteri TaxID=2136177 RepID=UPI000D3D2FE2|nr:SEL1-like repeat protein [Oceaniglobus ichthyenteri]